MPCGGGGGGGVGAPANAPRGIDIELFAELCPLLMREGVIFRGVSARAYGDAARLMLLFESCQFWKSLELQLALCTRAPYGTPP